jgi:hypothetical protein
MATDAVIGWGWNAGSVSLEGWRKCQEALDAVLETEDEVAISAAIAGDWAAVVDRLERVLEVYDRNSPPADSDHGLQDREGGKE